MVAHLFVVCRRHPRFLYCGLAHDLSTKNGLRRHLTLRNFIILLAAWLGLITICLPIVVFFVKSATTRAVLLMGLSLTVLWIVLLGSVMYRFRNVVVELMLRIQLDRRIKFILLATLLALIEEAITVSLTNLAPVFGVPVGAAYITASANYLDVVCLHSVVVFIPMFICWSLVLDRYSFSTGEVFVLFGLTGTIAESMIGGSQALAEAGFWIFVYGLMVFLPAYTFHRSADRPRPPVWMFPVAVLLPILFSAPVALLVSTLHPIPIHFPPIQP